MRTAVQNIGYVGEFSPIWPRRRFHAALKSIWGHSAFARLQGQASNSMSGSHYTRLIRQTSRRMGGGSGDRGLQNVPSTHALRRA